MADETARRDEEEVSAAYGDQHTDTGASKSQMRDGGADTRENATQQTAITASFTVPSADFELGRKLATAPVSRIELDPSISVGEPVQSRFWAETTDSSALEATLSDVSSIDTVEKIEENGTIRFQVQWAANIDGFIGHLLASGATVEEMTGTPKNWRFECRFENSEKLPAFHEACADADIVIDVNQLHHSASAQSRSWVAI